MNGEAYVIDASVAIKLFITEEFSDNVTRLLARLADDPPLALAVPDLFYIECANILWKHVKRFGYPSENARKDIESLAQLALDPYPTVSLVTGALELAVHHGISAYDACYIALAQRLGVPLVTADEKLARRLVGTPYKIAWIGAPQFAGNDR